MSKKKSLNFHIIVFIIGLHHTDEWICRVPLSQDKTCPLQTRKLIEELHIESYYFTAMDHHLFFISSHIYKIVTCMTVGLAWSGWTSDQMTFFPCYFDHGSGPVLLTGFIYNFLILEWLQVTLVCIACSYFDFGKLVYNMRFNIWFSLVLVVWSSLKRTCHTLCLLYCEELTIVN